MTQEGKILVVDDELSACKGCKRIFEEEGYSVEIALSGKEGLDKAREELFDAIIVDLKMPDVSGMEVLRNIKQEQPNVAVVMITGYASVPTATEAMKLGAEDYLPKPFTPDEISQVMEKALERKKEPNKGAEQEKVVKERVVDKEEVLRVLNRAIEDDEFWPELMQSGSEALKDYNLSSEARDAIVSGDIDWIGENVGKLIGARLRYLRHRYGNI